MSNYDYEQLTSVSQAENIVDPVACFITIFITAKTSRVISALTLLGTLLASYIIAMAALSPNPLLVDHIGGGILVVSSTCLWSSFLLLGSFASPSHITPHECLLLLLLLLLILVILVWNSDLLVLYLCLFFLSFNSSSPFFSFFSFLFPNCPLFFPLSPLLLFHVNFLIYMISVGKILSDKLILSGSFTTHFSKNEQIESLVFGAFDLLSFASTQILFWICCTMVMVYTKVSIAAVMRSQGRLSLIWTGASTQAGSFIGAILAYLMVNYLGVFRDAPWCEEDQEGINSVLVWLGSWKKCHWVKGL